MGVYIKGMKMPKKCGECGIYVCYRTWHGDPGDEFCGLTKKNVTYKTKPEWCPLSEAQERKTGKWLCSDDLYETAVCSCCGWDTTEPWQHIKSWFEFCPHCGADMRTR